MAVNAKKMFNKADILVAVTGLTKSGGSETEDKPVGTIYIDFIFPEYHLQILLGNSNQIVHQTIKKQQILLRHI